MRQVVLAFAVLSTFYACANSENPPPNSNPTPPVDAAADKRDTGKPVTGDSAVEEDAEVEEDAAVEEDAGADTSTPDTSTPDTSTPDTSTPDTSTPDTATDAPDDVATDAPPADAGCHDIVAPGGALTIDILNQAAPAATGGTIANGTYSLTDYNQYSPGSTPGKGSLTLEAVIRINGNVIESVQNQGAGLVRRAGTYTTTGSTINISWTCIVGTSASSETGSYTVAGNVLKYYPFAGYEAQFTKP